MVHPRSATPRPNCVTKTPLCFLLLIEAPLPGSRHRRLLFAHLKKRGSAATYMLSGWTKGTERRHVVRLVAGDDAALATARAALAEVTGEHVYSVQSTPIVHAEHLNALCAESAKQVDAMFDAPPGTPNALRDHRHSAVSCPLVKRHDGPGRRKAPSKSSAEATGSALAHAATTAAAARKPNAPVAAPVNAEVKTEPKGPGPFAGFKPVPKPSGGTAPSTAPAPAQNKSKPAAPSKSAKANMMAMFAKAPPKKAPSAAPPADDAIAANEESSDEEEEEEIMEAPRRGRGRRVLTGVDDDDEEMEPEPEPELEAEPEPELEPEAEPEPEPEPEPVASKAKEKKGKEVSKKRKSTEKAKAAVDTLAAEAEAGAKVAPSPEKTAAKAAATPMTGFFTSSSAGAGGGSKARKKKVVTVMDDETGEEFTKTVWVDEDGNEVGENTGGGAQALGEKTNAPSPARKEAQAPAKAKPAVERSTSAAAKPAPAKKATGGIMNFFKKG